MRWTLVQFQKSAGRAIVRACSNSSFSDLRPVTFVFPLRALSRRLSAGLYEMKANEQFRNIPANVYELHLALAGLPKDMKVVTSFDVSVSETTVDELLARTAWPPGLMVTAPRQPHPKSVVKITKAPRKILKDTGTNILFFK